MNTVPIPKVDVVKRKSAVGFAANNPVWDLGCSECRYDLDYRLTAITSNVQDWVYQYDLNSNIEAITNSSGTVVWQQHPTPFGEIQETIATGIENLKSFPGQYRDSDTGYSYNYYRDYDPTIGRYVQSDPIGLNGGLNGGLNTYAYVQNMPTQLIDPFGLKTLWCQRPLGDYSGENGAGPIFFNHQFLCVTLDDGSMRCDSLNNVDNDTNGFWRPSPGQHSLPERDNVETSVCTLVDGDENSCFEDCVVEEWSKPLSDYAIGPFGEDCQEYTHEIYRTCTLQCGYQNMR